MKILFMGGHKLGKLALQNLIEKGCNVIGVVITDTDNEWYKGVDEIALKYALPLYKTKNINNPDFIEEVKCLSPDIIVVANFEQILKSEIIALPLIGCINTHASLLPKYRGRAPLNWAIINGETTTGITVHYIEKGIDTGDIIIQEQIPIHDTDYIGDLLEKVEEIYPRIIYRAINLIGNGKVNRIKQNLSEGFYCGKRTAKDGQINWSKGAKDILNLIRAVSRPYPGAYTYLDNKKLIIWRAELLDQKEYEKPISNGTVIYKSNGYAVVKAADYNIKLTDTELVDSDMPISEGCELSYKED